MFSDGQCWYREIKLFLFSRACARHDGLYGVSERIEKLRQSFSWGCGIRCCYLVCFICCWSIDYVGYLELFVGFTCVGNIHDWLSSRFGCFSISSELYWFVVAEFGEGKSDWIYVRYGHRFARESLRSPSVLSYGYIRPVMVILSVIYFIIG